MVYTPPKKILERYADVLVNFALGHGKGIKRGEVVHVVIKEYAKPLLDEINKEVLRAGGHMILQYLPDEFDRGTHVNKDFYKLADDKQINFFPEKYYRGIFDSINHFLIILADTNLQALTDTNQSRVLKRAEAMRPYLKWRLDADARGELSWTLALYGTKDLAKEAQMSEKEYWKQIINACYLDQKSPIAEWKKIMAEIEKFRRKLSAMKIEKVHVEGPDADLWIKIGKDRKWLGGGGANIPSFEIFTSPDWRETEGWIRFSEPLYRNGVLIKGIELHFKDGKVIESKAKKNEKALKELLKAENGNKVGEFSLTDKRHSRITKFMAHTLYDENVGGEHGNTHIAVGSAYKDAYTGDIKKMSEKDWEKVGFNDSTVHCDIVSTTPRTVTAHLSNGKEKVIYKDGMFTLD